MYIKITPAILQTLINYFCKPSLSITVNLFTYTSMLIV
nr:MAG TPA: hypothetical protein [Caudoviricetes sp.]DAS19623.1 MAG TPA: hypothetical protein [Caudoviricetes sp.]